MEEGELASRNVEIVHEANGESDAWIEGRVVWTGMLQDETDDRENACDDDDYVDDIGDENGSVYDGESQNNNLLS